jgi:hypothetical protein
MVVAAASLASRRGVLAYNILLILLVVFFLPFPISQVGTNNSGFTRAP